MHEQAVRVCHVDNGLNLFRRVHRGHFRGLRERHQTGLAVVRAAHICQVCGKSPCGNLAVHGGDGGHLAAHDGLDRPAFRGVRVGHVAAQNGVPRAYHAVEPEHVRARAERDEEHVDVIAEQRLEAAFGFGGPRVVAIRLRRAHVGLVQGLHHFRVHATGIVAGKSAIHLAASFRQMSFGKAWRRWGGEEKLSGEWESTSRISPPPSPPSLQRLLCLSNPCPQRSLGQTALKAVPS